MIVRAILIPILLVVAGSGASGQVRFAIPITVECASQSAVLRLGVNGDGPAGAILDNTKGLDYDSEYGEFLETQLPPYPPEYTFDARFKTLPGNPSAFPLGLGTGTAEDFRGFSAWAQVDSFRIFISGTAVESNPVTIHWPADLERYGSAWKLVPIAGSFVAETDMISDTTVTISPIFGPLDILIVKTGLIEPEVATLTSTPSSVDFATVLAWETAYRMVTIRHTSIPDTVIVYAVEMPDSVFTINPPFALPITLSSTDSSSIELAFSPKSAGNFTGVLRALYNGGADTLDIPLSGMGLSDGARLDFAQPVRSVQDNTQGHADTVGLIGYTGSDVTALQFTIINSKPSLRISSVSRGAAIMDSTKWYFDSDVKHGLYTGSGGSMDTVTVVMFALGLEGLPAGSHPDLLRFSYETANATGYTPDTVLFSFHNVVGSTAFGEDAGIAAGLPQSVSIINSAARGDVNNDDRMDINDLVRVVQHILGRAMIPAAYLPYADLAPWATGDGAVNARDLALLNTIILTGQFPDGTILSANGGAPALSKATVLPSAASSLADSPSVELRFTLEDGLLSIDVANTACIAGLQIELHGVVSADGEASQTQFGDMASNVRPDGTLVLLLYSSSGESLQPGDWRKLASIPILASPGFRVKSTVVAGCDGTPIGDVSTSLLSDITSMSELPSVADLYLETYPNPFLGSLAIEARGLEGGAKVLIYATNGQLVYTSAIEGSPQDVARIIWTGRDRRGTPVSSGYYTVVLQTLQGLRTKRVLLMGN